MSLNAAAAKKAPKKAAAAKKDTVESLRKKEFVAIMAEELGYTKADAEAALTCALDIVSNVSTLRVWVFYELCVGGCACTDIGHTIAATILK